MKTKITIFFTFLCLVFLPNFTFASQEPGGPPSGPLPCWGVPPEYREDSGCYPSSVFERFLYELNDGMEISKGSFIFLSLFPLTLILALFFVLRKKYTGKNHPYALYVLLLTPTPLAFAIGKDLAGPWVILFPLVFIAYIFWRAIFKANLKSWHRILVILGSFLYVILWGGLLLWM